MDRPRGKRDVPWKDGNTATMSAKKVVVQICQIKDSISVHITPKKKSVRAL